MTRAKLILIVAFLSLALAGCDDSSGELTLEDRVLGDPEAPITILEYASLTCPHCAHFEKATLPKLKREWFDTGRAKLIFRDFPLDENAKTAAVIARCAPKDDYYRVLGVFFSRQASWARMADPVPVLTQIAVSKGLTREQVQACLDDGDLVDGVLQMRLQGQSKYGIDSTPTFIVGERVISGALSFEDFDALLRSMERRQ